MIDAEVSWTMPQQKVVKWTTHRKVFQFVKNKRKIKSVKSKSSSLRDQKSGEEKWLSQ